MSPRAQWSAAGRCLPKTFCKLTQFEAHGAAPGHDIGCEECPAGFWCDGSAVKTACLGVDGAYQDAPGQQKCKVCEACNNGMILDGCGSAHPGTCAACAAGYVKASHFSCKQCSSGTYDSIISTRGPAIASCKARLLWRRTGDYFLHPKILLCVGARCLWGLFLLFSRASSSAGLSSKFL